MPGQSELKPLGQRVIAEIRRIAHGLKLHGVTPGRAVLAVTALCLVFLLVSYFKIARMTDRRLEDGPFSAGADILTAPRTLAAGDAVSRDEVVQSLQQSGYARGAENRAAGWFTEKAGALEIHPGAESLGGGAARLEFANGKLASIVSLEDNQSRQQYLLDPPLLANLSSTRERRRLVQFADIPQSLVHAVISVEDKHFFQHGGFDVGRMLKAAYIDVKDGRKREGASTLTMQLARSLWLDRGKSWRRKLEETFITEHLEHNLTKQQIFEDYANEIYLGEGGTFSINGFGEAAQVFFGKDLSQVDTAEAATLAGMIRRPAYYNPFRSPDKVRQRRNLVLSLMRTNGYLSEPEYREAAAEPLRIAPEHAEESASSYFIGLMNNELRAKFGEDGGGNRRVYTTLEPQLQEAAQAAVRTGMAVVDRQLRARPDHTGLAPAQPQVALIAVDPHTGEIKALVGGRDYEASQLNHALAMRQPGSVFKPFVYAAALATAVEGGRQVFTPASMLSDDSTTSFANGDQTYQPKDFHGDSMGDVTLRTALADSLNVATVSLAQQVGYQKVVAMARRAGLNDAIKATPSVALGSYEVTPLEVAGAYTMFANHGVRVTPTTIAAVRSRDGQLVYRHEPETRTVLDPKVAYLMVSMMEEVLRSGTGAGARSMGFTLPAAGKTGTSRDGWFAGFTDGLLCVVWVGFDDNRDLNLEGARSALPVWAEFMRRAAQLHEYGATRYFQRPQGVVSVEICAESGQLAGEHCPNTRPEVFVAGTEPSIPCSMHSRQIGTGDH